MIDKLPDRTLAPRVGPACGADLERKLAAVFFCGGADAFQIDAREDATREHSLTRSAVRKGTVVRNDIGTGSRDDREIASPVSRRLLLGIFQLFAVAVIGMIAIALARAGAPLPLADPKASLQQAWTHQRFGDATDYETVELNGVTAIRAIGRDSASGLYRETAYRIKEHPWLEWAWRVDQLQRTADISRKSHEDFAGAIFLIFGRPSMLNRDVPTLAYVWTSDLLPRGAVVDSPHHPGSVRSVVVRSGGRHLGQWVRERRNVLQDFREAFGQDPPETVEMVALFTDNDQTGEPVVTYYGAVSAVPDELVDIR